MQNEALRRRRAGNKLKNRAKCRQIVAAGNWTCGPREEKSGEKRRLGGKNTRGSAGLCGACGGGGGAQEAAGEGASALEARRGNGPGSASEWSARLEQDRGGQTLENPARGARAAQTCDQEARAIITLTRGGLLTSVRAVLALRYDADTGVRRGRGTGSASTRRAAQRFSAFRFAIRRNARRAAYMSWPHDLQAPRSAFVSCAEQQRAPLSRREGENLRGGRASGWNALL